MNRKPAFNLRNRMPVSMPASGRASAGSAVKGERNPWTAFSAPGAPPAAEGFQKSFSERSRRTGSLPEAGSARRRTRGSSAAAAECHGYTASAAPCDEKTRP